MLLNLDQLSDAPPLPRFDVCIIGAGAAGIAAAVKLTELGRRVLVCDGGGEEYTAESQDTYIGEVIGDPYFDLDSARLRFLGGSMNHWSGLCRSFEAVDFDRGYLGPEFEWPISKDDMDAFLPEARSLLDLPAEYQDRIVDEEFGVVKPQFDISWVNFGETQRARFEASETGDILLNANLTGLVKIEGTGRIGSAQFTGYSGRTIKIEADAFVFAMGGIENSRQLMHHQRLHNDALVNPASPIGQYWMEHPHFNLGQALVSTAFQELAIVSLDGAVQKELGVMGCGFRVDRQGGTKTRRLVNNLLCVAPAIGSRIAGLADKNLVCGVRIKAAWEQAPVAQNRVELNPSETDAFGVPLTQLYWKKSPIDRETLVKSIGHLAEYCSERGIGRFRLQDWLAERLDYPENDELAGFHHMGGTRMAKTPELGVVDGNCRVFGTDNLYMAGSSVFTTGGHKNPTLPIVSLALRLGDHLANA